MKNWNWKVWLAAGVIGLLVGIALTYPLALLAVGACALAWRLNRKLWWLPAALGLVCAWVLANAAAGAAALPRCNLDGCIIPHSPPVTPVVWASLKPASMPDRAGRMGLLLGVLGGLALAWHRRSAVLGKHGPGKVQGRPAVEGGWADDAEAGKVCRFGPPKPGDGGLILGALPGAGLLGSVGPGRMVRFVPGGEAGHAAVFGASGSGKTWGFVLPNIVSAARERISMVVTDPKGELVAGKYNKNKEYEPGAAAWLDKQGYRVLVLNFENPSAGSHRWNPLMECHDDPEFRALCDAMITSVGPSSAAFWEAGEKSLFTAVLGLVRFAPGIPGEAEIWDEHRHLYGAMSVLAWPEDRLDEAFEIAYREKKCLSDYFYMRWAAARGPKLPNFRQGVSSKLAPLTDGPLAMVTAASDFTLESIGQGDRPTALFVILPTEGNLRPILTAFYFFLFRRLREVAKRNFGRLPIPVRFLMDEFANIGRIPDFEKRIAFDRSYGMNYVCIMQALSQFTDLYGANEAQTILANMDVQLALRVNDTKTANYFSHQLGEARVWDTTERKDVTHPWNRLEIPKKTESTKRMALMEPWQFRELPKYTAVALAPTIRPMYLKTVAFDAMPEYREIPKDPVKVSAFAPPVPPGVPPVPPIPKAKEKDKAGSPQADGGSQAGSGGDAGSDQGGGGRKEHRSDGGAFARSLIDQLKQMKLPDLDESRDGEKES